MNKVSVQRLRELMFYSPDTGELRWKVSRSNFVPAGSPAISCKKNTGHLCGNLDGVYLQAHRVAWAIHYGEWPAGDIDHINGIRDDNRICNLRIVSREQNARNRRPNKNKASGLPHGVCRKNNGRFYAQIQMGGKTVHLGYFYNAADASRAYHAAKRQYGFHKNHGLKAMEND